MQTTQQQLESKYGLPTDKVSNLAQAVSAVLPNSSSRILDIAHSLLASELHRIDVKTVPVTDFNYSNEKAIEALESGTILALPGNRKDNGIVKIENGQIIIEGPVNLNAIVKSHEWRSLNLSNLSYLRDQNLNGISIPTSGDFTIEKQEDVALTAIAMAFRRDRITLAPISDGTRLVIENHGWDEQAHGIQLRELHK